MENIIKKNYYIFLDNEMGGVEIDKYSFLTSYLMVVDADFKIIDDLYLYLKPDDGIYKVCASSMEVNQIDLIEHDKKAITYKEAGTKLYLWLKKHTNDGQLKLMPIGHGVGGDIMWIVEHLISRGSWEKFISHRRVDTLSACQFLKTCNCFPETVSGSLESLSEHFKLTDKVCGSLHDAKVDTWLNYYVFLELRKIIVK